MKVTRITEDDWRGSANQSTQSNCDSVEQFEQAISRLNGINKTLLVVETAHDMMMTIGGGNDGRFVVQIVKGTDEQFHTLCQQDNQSDEVVEVVSGGQAGMYPVRHCVDKEAALVAARYFAETASPCPELKWEIEG